MPKSFTQVTQEHGGEVLFTSSQGDILNFLQGAPLVNYEGICLALVLMWFKQDTSKARPDTGIRAKVAALRLQHKMEASWAGFATAVSTAKELLGKNFWWQSESLHVFANWFDPAVFVLNDPGHGREGLHLIVLYFKEGSAHAIGAWRFPTGAVSFYDPNHGACAVRGEMFSSFL